MSARSRRPLPARPALPGSARETSGPFSPRIRQLRGDHGYRSAGAPHQAEVLATFDHVAAALVPGGVFVARVPNAVSPFGGHIRNGDFTHQTSFTARSIRQLAAAAGFDTVLARSSPPIAHGWRAPRA